METRKHRLIDAATVIERIKAAFCDGCDHYEFLRCRSCRIQDVLNIFDETQDATVLNAQEIEDLQNLRKIKSGEAVKIATSRYTIINEAWRKKHPAVLARNEQIRYCPYCGAMMDGGDGNGRPDAADD